MKTDWQRGVSGPTQLRPGPLGLDDILRARLASSFAPLDELLPRLAARAVAWIERGEDVALLDKLASTRGTQAALAPLGTAGRESWAEGSCPRKALVLAAERGLDPRYLVRLGVLLAACVEPQTVGCTHITSLGVGVSHLLSKRFPAWLEMLLWEQADLEAEQPVRSRVSTLLRALEEAGESPEVLVRAAMESGRSMPDARTVLLRSMEGMDTLLEAHAALVRAYLETADKVVRSEQLVLFERGLAHAAPWLDLVTRWSLEGAREDREQAARELARHVPRSVEELLSKLRHGTVGQRERAAEVLGWLAHESAIDPLERAAQADRSSVVRSAAQAALELTRRKHAGESRDGGNASVAPVRALGPEVHAAFQEVCKTFDERDLRHHQRVFGPLTSVAVPPRLSGAECERVLGLMSMLEPWSELPAPLPHPARQRHVSLYHLIAPEHADPVLDRDEVLPIHLVRYAFLVCGLSPLSRGAPVYTGFPLWAVAQLLDRYAHRIGTLDLTAVGRLLAYVGTDPAELALRQIIEASPPFDWEPERQWGFLAEHGELYERVFGLGPAVLREGEYDEAIARALETLGWFPDLPERLRPLVWELAIGPAKTHREAAQRCYARAPDRDAKLLAALTDKKRETRAEAASWLANLRAPHAIEAIKGALAKEKHPHTFVRMVEALLRLGEPAERIVDRSRLESDARAAMKAGVPEALAWFPWSEMPELRWSDGGRVDTDISKSWLVQAHRQKSPEAGGYVAYRFLLDEPSREAFGDWVLATWLAEDLRTPTELSDRHEEAFRRRAKTEAAEDGLTEDAYYEMLRERHLATPLGSAVAHKGLLALASAFGGESIARRVQTFLRTYYGWRAPQCKALLAMLAWVEHPSAAQLLLSTAARFRTAGIRSEAEAQAQALAERRGWSVEELADRCVPAAGLDDDGQLVLTYAREDQTAPRTIAVRLQNDLRLHLFEDDRELSHLPEARAGDVLTSVESAAKQLATAQKQLKALVTQQRVRLFSAMCTERCWSYADWRRYLHEHPVLGKLSTRCIWAECNASGAVSQAFRPREDGTLTGADGAPLRLHDDAHVRLHHGSLLHADAVRAWKQHLADSGVTLLFGQLERGAVLFEASAASVDAFRGHMIEDVALRNAALKLGYERGPAQDGGWFCSYDKAFVGLGIRAQLNFSGTRPDGGRLVAIESLTFERVEPRGATRPLRLKEVPRILLTECHHDLREIAAKGTGFCSTWEQIVR